MYIYVCNMKLGQTMLSCVEWIKGKGEREQSKGEGES